MLVEFLLGSKTLLLIIKFLLFLKSRVREKQKKYQPHVTHSSRNKNKQIVYLRRVFWNAFDGRGPVVFLAAFLAFLLSLSLRVASASWAFLNSLFSDFFFWMSAMLTVPMLREDRMTLFFLVLRELKVWAPFLWSVRHIVVHVSFWDFFFWWCIDSHLELMKRWSFPFFSIKVRPFPG